ncbi:transcriptional regulator, ArsR family [Neorhodopirellula lusitana]|uniref:Transcriptional regulator, ArsR family n=1 Tax=Neorhodopirellula lusitana TaxID=445327 RepID=A0ABY1Q031_9BACT|nr:metalloregulator ArsR/SmtB family transcription factor [Neorhodopirellula lusitana]SMP50312.1 transcriptional regulator, ArsR family [Neorhodopirellula lusitana]
MGTTKNSRPTGDKSAVVLAEIGEDINTIFRAFADSTRLRILHLLVEYETCVGDIVETLQLPQPTVSRHLAYLRKANLVEVRKDGLWSYYSLAEAQSCFQQRLYDCLNDCFNEVPELQEDARRAKRLRETGGCCE